MSAISSLSWRRTEGAGLVLRGAEVVDPRAGIRGPHDVVIREGEIAELTAPGSADADELESVDAEGRLALPAFFDPHVHLRAPGHEHKEDLETGTRAAAAGGF
jgi:dihydroorotase